MPVLTYEIKTKTIIKTLIIVMFLGFVTFEVYKSSTESESQSEPIGFFSTDLLDVTEIQIHAGTKHILLVKKNLDWKIEKPITEFADIDQINTWLQQVVNSKAEAVPAEYKSRDWEKFGLSDPIGKIRFKIKNGTFIDLDVSAKKSFNDQFYIKYTKNNISELLLSDFPWLDFIVKKPIDFVSSKDIFNYNTDDVVEVRLKDRGVFSKSDGLWAFKGEQKIDPARVTGLLNDLKNLKIISLESNQIHIPKKDVFNLEVISEDKTNEVIQAFDNIKDCKINGAIERCQLMRVASSSYPFWVQESKIKSIISSNYFKKIK
jgi:hypothetical protein